MPNATLTPARARPDGRPLLVLLGWVALALIVWFVGPLLQWGDWQPLAGDTARAIAMAALAALAAAHASWQALRLAQHNRALVDGLAVAAAAPGQTAGGADVAAIRERFDAALQVLRQGRIGVRRGWRGVGRRYVYELPWFVMVGAPGAGKTTALVHSGLQFPLAEKLGGKVVRGIGGTRHCDWWFTDRAVLIDTAGRYTTQDSDRETDRAGWLGFLDLLAKHRPQRPIDGVLLTLSADDLLSQDAAARVAHARELRARLDELRQRLSVRPPVYVLVTKTDLIAGFAEFFADYDRDERSQVWGVSFPLPAGGLVDGGGESDPLARLSSDLAGIEKRLDDQLFARLRDETDRDRSAALYAFPQQWRMLRDALAEVVLYAFAPAKDGQRPLLRGLYFTSATQEGTPMDRALGSVARAMGLAHRVVAPARASGKTYFVTGLVRDVILGEVGLLGGRRRAARLQQRVALGACAVGALAVAATAVLGWRAERMQQALLADTRDALAPLPAALDTAAASPATDLIALVPVLDRVAPAAANEAPSAPQLALDDGLAADVGLDRRATLAAARRDAYRELLRDTLLPRIAARLEARLRQPAGEDLALTREALKAYLMLFDGQHVDHRALRAYLAADWQQSLPADTPAATRAALLRHLDALLAEGEAGAPARADRALIDTVRERVAGVPLELRLYSRLRTADLGRGKPDIGPLVLAGADAPRVFMRSGGAALGDGVPALYGRGIAAGSGLRQQAEATLEALAAEDPWVLGPAAAPAPTGAGRSALIDAVDARYRRDLAVRWEAMVGDLRLASAPDLATTTEQVQLLAAPEGPLAGWSRGLARELPPGALADEWTAFAGSATGASGATSTASAGSSRLLGLAPLQARLGKLSTQLVAAADAIQRRADPPPLDALQELADAAPRVPVGLQPVLTALLERTAGQLYMPLREGLERELAATVTSACSRAVDGRYPIVRDAATEIEPGVFAATFGGNGLLDGWFRRRLAPFVDTTSRPWRWRAGVPAPAGQSPALLAFQRAQAIRELLLAGGVAAPSLQLELRLVELDPALAQFVIEADGQALRFTRDNARTPQTLRWPGGQGGRRLQVQAGNGTPYGFDGPWALWRLLDRVRVEPAGAPDRLRLLFDIEGRRARFEARSDTPQPPVSLVELEQFACPRRL